MQELIEQLKEERDGFLKLPPHSNIQERTENCFGSCIEIAERMLQKEEEVINDAYLCGLNRGVVFQQSQEMGVLCEWPSDRDYYEETFNPDEE